MIVNPSMRGRRAGQAGFSLIELMIAMVAGLIVMGAVLSFTMASIRSHSDNILATRLNQDLRVAMALMTRELRRAGFDQTAETRVGLGTAATAPFTPVFVSDDESCVVFAYDREGGTAGAIDDGEIKALRRTTSGGVGVIQFNPQADGADTCDGDEGWADLTDPVVVNVTTLTFTPVETGEAPLLIRSVAVTVEAELVRSADISATTTTAVRIRADCVNDTASNCWTAPGAAPVAADPDPTDPVEPTPEPAV